MADTTGIEDNSFEDDDIIELTEIVEEVSEDSQEDDGILDLTDAIDADTDDLDDGFIELTDMVEEINSTKPPKELDIDDSEIKKSLAIEEVTQDQVQAALESLIEKKFGDTIDTMILKTMEDVLEKEISIIKERFQDLLDKLGKA
ncbi:MAG: hypothetical protein GY729_07925 [Desulfobacteraceae bacterium]|nr:hypothetical protein [Desulfobacteraceae bacterium]